MDELRILPVDRARGDRLHGLLSERYDARKSVLVTTSVDLGRWVEVFESKETTVALLDRLTHRSDVVVMTGRSKRPVGSPGRQKRRRARPGKDVVRAQRHPVGEEALRPGGIWAETSGAQAGLGEQ